MPVQVNKFTQNSFGAPVSINTVTEVDQKVTDAISTANTNAAAAITSALGTSVQTVDGSSATVTLADAAGPILVLVNPASVVTSLQIKMPPNPKEGQSFTIVFGGTIAPLSPVVTAFSIAVNNAVTTGWSLLQQTTPDTPVGGDTIVLRAFPSIKKVIRTL